MTRFQVDPDAVLSATSAVRATIGRIQSEASGLSAQLTALESSWQGAAATSFQQVAAEWFGIQRQLEEQLGVLATALGAAANQYSEVEGANLRLFVR